MKPKDELNRQHDLYWPIQMTYKNRHCVYTKALFQWFIRIPVHTLLILYTGNESQGAGSVVVWEVRTWKICLPVPSSVHTLLMADFLQGQREDT
jgi:hypothetical protein